MTILSTGSVADFTEQCGRLTRVTRPDERDEGPEPHHRLPVDPDVEADEDDRRLGHTATVPHEFGAVLAQRWDVLLVVTLGGALGSLGRWGLGEALAGSGSSFPWATFVENVSGSFALGVLVVVLLERWPRSRYLRPFLGVGVLGGFTTFSTYALDLRTLVAADHLALVVTYLVGTLLAALLAAWLGITAARRVVGG
jgi:fluoride exporter